MGTLHSKVLGWSDPAVVFHALYGEAEHAFWLDAGPGADSGFSYLGAAAPGARFVTASVAAGTVTSVRLQLTHAAPPTTTTETIFDFLRHDVREQPALVGAASTRDGFTLGWVGWLGYELGRQTVGVPGGESRHPDAALLEVERMLIFDHAARSVTLLARADARHTVRSVEKWLDATVAAIGAASEAPDVPAVVVHRARPGASAVAIWREGPEAYAALIEQCLNAIRAGDAYQLCLTTEITVAGSWHPVDSYLTLRSGSPSHHGGLLRFAEIALLSASPEEFLHVTRAGEIRSKPIKGTRARSADAILDGRLKIELEHSDKERAENLMIVDLMRNDLGRVAELGSVAVSSLLAVESYPHVHQLVSTIEARLAPGVSAIDAIESCFPAGSMTGAPKQSAMTILHSLERAPRGIYAGAFGYLGLDGAADLAIVIRSIVLDSAGASVGTGGGITALSNAADEIEETRIKAAALLTALGPAAAE